jgi:colanic acid/amylovoran biosynthesis protein
LNSRAPTNILIVNTHSVLNSGDASIVLAQVRLLQRKFPRAQISITSRTPDLDKLYYEPLKIRVLPPFFPVPSLYPSLVGKIGQVLKGGLSIAPKSQLLREIRKSDLVVSSGGGYFFSHRRYLPGPMFLQNFFSVKAATICRKQVVMFPQSFGPLFSPLTARMLKGLLENERVLKIYAREPTSQAFLQQLLNGAAIQKTELCPDLAFLLAKNQASSPKPWLLDLPKPVLALTARHWNFPGAMSRRDQQEKRRLFLTSLEEACLEFHRKWKGSIVIVPQARGPGFLEDDRKDSQTIWRRLRPLVSGRNLAYLDLPPLMSPSEMIDIFSQADLVLATRFHSAIFGLALGIPVISIAYQAKSLSTLKWLGLDDWSLAMNEISPEKIIRLMERIFQESVPLREKIGRQIARARTTIESRLGTFLETIQESRKAG